jgi:hypothetical protein
MPADEMRGAANWDKLPGRELLLTMNKDDCPYQRWADAPLSLTPFPLTYEATDPSGLLVSLASHFRANGYDGARFELQGADGGVQGGGGAYVSGILDFDELSRLPGFLDLKLRLSHNGSAAVVLQQLLIPAGGGFPQDKLTWLAVAGAGGGGHALFGGNAGSAVQIASRGGDQAHTHIAANLCGGGGGGRLSTPEPPGPGQGASPGTQMPTGFAFVLDPTQQTGGVFNGVKGGDGYYGGGADDAAGGGGGSYVSPYMRYIDTSGGVTPTTPLKQAKVIIHPLIRLTRTPKFNIHIWLRRYNMFRIYGGRGAVMFAE